MTCRLRRRVLHSSALPVTDDDGLHSIFLSDGGDSGRVTACPPASSVRLTTGATPLLLVATSRRSSMGLEQALRLGERVVETLGINRDRAAVIARLDRQHQLSFLKTGEPEQLAAEPELRCAVIGLSTAYDSDLDHAWRPLAGR